MTISDEIRKMIIQRASAQEIGHLAVEQGMKTLRTVGLEKVKQGLSTFEQVLILTSAG
jgi:type II secretory ATPase GspE/PulE/Tfp pilus assembly ATPase PilB-like protein